MRWMEFIKVQTVKKNIAAKLLNLVHECKTCQGLLEAKVFNNASVDDLSLCLHWKTDVPDRHGSPLGLHLSHTLKKYGLVDHSVWVERDEREEKKS